MKVVILAGGYGSRLGEETDVRPKPLVEIGGRPIIWHIMKIYQAHGFNDFIVCLGYKGHLIKEYFLQLHHQLSDFTVDIETGRILAVQCRAPPWKVTLVDTGLDTMTGGRLLRASPYLDEGTFLMTYGDGVGDVNVQALIAAHKAHGKLATVTAVQPVGRFGVLHIDAGGIVDKFEEKPAGDGTWINGGFFVLDRRVLTYIRDGATPWEQEPMLRLAAEGQLAAYRHRGFWRPMDTLSDKRALEALWASGNPPWKIWKD